MSLTASMLIGRSALTASQLGIQVSGNNIANVATPGYSRQTAFLEPVGSDGPNASLRSGRGVNVRDVRRQIDEALQQRLWNGVSDQTAAAQQLQSLSTLEATLGELTGNDFTTQLTGFFNVWSERANLTKSSAVVVQQASKISEFLRRMRSDIDGLRSQIDAQLGAGVAQANKLLETVSDLSRRISISESGQGLANSLRDQRDQVLSELSQLLDVTVVPQSNGSINVLLGNTPIILNNQSRGLTLDIAERNGVLEADLKTSDNAEFVVPQSGQIGALLASRKSSVDQTSAALDSMASRLIFEVNKLHSTGVNKDWQVSATGTLAFATADRTRPLNDPANAATSVLPFAASSGGFNISIKNNSTGATQTVRINVDLDGINALGQPGTSDDTTAEQIRAALAAVPGVSASFNAEGKLQISAASGSSISFSDDTSGALALLGVNSFFGGKDARDIAVRPDLVADPSKLLVGRMVNGTFVENANALEFAKLQTRTHASLQDRSFLQAWGDTVQGVGSATAAAKTAAAAASSVKESLDAQRSAISGVSIDEESINLLNYQRQYQAGARLIDISNQLLNSLLQIV